MEYKEGFYFLDTFRFGTVMYEYRNGILSYYGDSVCLKDEKGVFGYKKFDQYAWFLSERKDLKGLVYLEDL